MIATDSGELPTDENNLIYKSGKTDDGDLSYQWRRERSIWRKHIPMATGMAGGEREDLLTTLKRNEPSV